MPDIDSQTVALIGGGPAALFFFKHVTAKKINPKKIVVFEQNPHLGMGMPYGTSGAGKEHVANISSNEIPELVTDIEEFIQKNDLGTYGDFKTEGKINRDQVVPRLVLGKYLENQFKILVKHAKSQGIEIEILLNTKVTDIQPVDEVCYKIVTSDGEKFSADVVVLSTGHQWTKSYENKHEGWFDSPYPPSKFTQTTNFPVAVKGASLTAVDIIRTLSRLNGKFSALNEHQLEYILNHDAQDFKIDLYSLSGLLPALRFHSEDEAFSTDWKMSLKEIYEYKKKARWLCRPRLCF